MKWSNTLVTTAALVAFGAVGVAQAGSIREQQSFGVWKKQDECAKQAFLKFPDYTKQSNADRERAMRDCDIAKGVPVRAPIAESPVKTIPDSAAD
jgi:hypothetical protein